MALINTLGFKTLTWDSNKETIVIPSNIRKRILNSLPKDYKTSWKYYLDGYICLSSYFTVFGVCLYNQYYHSNQYQTKHKTCNRLCIALMSPLVGWSAIGILVSGHEACHQTFAPKSTIVGALVNKITAFICIDSLYFSSWIWNREHSKHHKNVNVQGADDMYIRGSNIITEQCWALLLVLRYKWYTLTELLSFKFGVTDIARKLVIIAGYPFRYFILSASMNHDWFVVSSNLVSALVFLNYCGLLSHSLPVRSKGQTDDYFTQAMRETWDIFSMSGFHNFLHCGIGGHCSHHIMSYIPRSLYPMISRQLKQFCEDEYRVIDTWSDELWLWWNRREYM